ncbi:DsbA family protein [Paenarthrobacter sp. NPDC090522]|uniref:DsbA family protein n=1 Tax=Paenarthrobacter sp. NPDC090522 TaxID=3364383 RepID=UPI00380B9C22
MLNKKAGQGAAMPPKRRFRARWILYAAAAALTAALILFMAFRGQTRNEASMGSPSSEAGAVVAADPGNPLVIGSKDAPVVLIEWADPRCPYCALFTQETLPTLLKDYVDSGKVRFEFRDVAMFGEQSVSAGTGIRAAAAQGRFHAYLTTLYGAAEGHEHPDLPREKLIEFARTAGVPDLDRFEADLGSEALRQAVLASTTDARRLGVTGVPLFLADDRVLSGAQPVEVFKQVLDEALQAAETK